MLDAIIRMMSCSRENQFANAFIAPHCSSTVRYGGAAQTRNGGVVIMASRREITRLDAALIRLLLDGAHLGEEGETPRVLIPQNKFTFPKSHYLAWQGDRAGHRNMDAVKGNGMNMKT